METRPLPAQLGHSGLIRENELQIERSWIGFPQSGRLLIAIHPPDSMSGIQQRAKCTRSDNANSQSPRSGSRNHVTCCCGLLFLAVRELLHEDITDRNQEQADDGGDRHAENHAGAHGAA